MARLKLGVLISGRGSNMSTLINAAKNPDYPAEIAVVISNNPSADGLNAASKSGIPVSAISHKDYATPDEFEMAIHDRLTAAKVDLVCLAGFMRILSADFVGRWQDRLINIHPSLLPAFKGLHVHERIIESGGKISGCTVHYVRPEMDDGPIIIQAAVPVLPGDDADSLAARVLEAEHQIYPKAVEMIARGQIRVSGCRTLVERPDGLNERETMKVLVSPD